MRAAEVALTSEQRATLRSWLAAGKTERRLAFRAQIILAVAAGWRRARRRSASGVAALRGTAWRGWRMRRAAASRGTTRPRMSGGSRGFGHPATGRICALERHPAGQASGRHLQAPDLAGAAGARDFAGGRRSWGISTDPAFAQKAADIVALYLQPPENAVVLSVDEKPHIQALERAQGWLKLPNGKAL